MGTPTLVFADTETTSLRPDRRAWEIALIVRERGVDQEYHWFVPPRDLDLGNADPMSLRVGRFYERHPCVQTGLGGRPAQDLKDLYAMPDEYEILSVVEALTRNAVIVGAIPWFDTDVLAQRMRANDISPSWNHHLIDVEAFAAGASGITPPWNLDVLLSEFRVVCPEADRHTAMGDARAVRDLYDAAVASGARA